MFRTRFRKILRDIRSRKVRTALVSISIFIGVFGTVTLFSMGDLLVRQLRRDLDQNKLAMVRVYLALPPAAQVDNAPLLTTLRSQPHVTTVEGQAVYPISWHKTGETNFHSASVFAYSEPFGQIQLEPMRLVTGAFPQAGQKQIALERRFADKNGLKVGDTITVRVLSQSAGGSTAVPEETWTISGTVFFPYGYAGFTPPTPDESVFATYEDAQYLAGFKGFSSVYARFTDFAHAKEEAPAFAQAISSTTPYIPALNFVEDPAKNSQITFAQTIGGVMGSLGLLALIVSGFLVFNVLSAIVTEQRAQIGIMKTIGASRRDNFAIYSGMALVYGVIGVIPGVLLGIPSGFFAAKGLASSSNTFIETFGVSSRAIVLGIVVGLAIPVLASLIPVFNGTRVKIIEAITDLGIASSYGDTPLARFIARLPIPINMRQGISNVIRKKGRMAFTALTLIIAAGAFMGVYAVFVSIDGTLNTFFDTFNFQFVLSPTDPQKVDQVQSLVANDFDTLTLKGWYSSIAIDMDGFNKEFDPATGPPALFAAGYDPSTAAYQFKLAAGQGLQPDSTGVVMAKTTADLMHKEVGDNVVIHAGGHSGTYTILGLADYPYDGVWFTWQELSKLAGYVNQDGQPVPSGILYSMNRKSPTASQVDTVIDQVNEALLANGLTAEYSNIEGFKETIANAVATFRLVFNFTAFLIALVGAVGLLTALSMSVFERQKEIGVMRSVGAGSLTIVGQFLTEGLLIGLLAWLLGLPFSYVLGQGLMKALNLGDAYKLSYPTSTVVLGLVGMLIITTVSSLWPSLAAGRKTVSDILRYQ
jgi:ABC-type antimicrobial peptide transport system permease subunit